jgi:hypothetical protein
MLDGLPACETTTLEPRRVTSTEYANTITDNKNPNHTQTLDAPTEVSVSQPLAVSAAACAICLSCVAVSETVPARTFSVM